MKLYSYVVARDFGFAPNPFDGVCTLATCKPKIREAATVGDWVVGTGSKRYGLGGKLVFAMQVSEKLSYDEYWKDLRYRSKRPNLQGSLKQAYGDNIYHRNSRTKEWKQEDSHHSFKDGSKNPANVKHDTQSPIVLIGANFTYYGAAAIPIPKKFCNATIDVSAHRGHKSNFPEEFVEAFTAWLQGLGARGYVAAPAEFPK